MRNYDKQSKTIIILIFVLIAIIFGSYFLNFRSQQLSISTTDWGNFGDYIGGLLTPFLTLINIYVLLYITKIANKINYSLQEKSLENDKKISKRTFIYEIIKNIKDYSNELITAIKNNTKLDFDINRYKLNDEFEILKKTFDFSQLQQLTQEINNITNDIADSYSKHKFNSNQKIIQSLLKSRSDLISKMYNEFLK